ncbi:DUF4097 family beta strand repeat-containing protein [Acrocarpospora catenulata]|uniref:DUF4097 family beta strand repeat-containing protein n=1 Tax=Acrocarpospora catenulata TaxID=2836182 RepID=UPI001BDA5CD0|nr:DUF4097 family beta strand repeat-containing protein [Acrocarpospora catenulata]
MRVKQGLALAGAVMGAGLVLSGCGMDLNFGRSQAVQDYDVSDKVTALSVNTGAGDVVVNESDRTGIKVTETVHYRGERPEGGHRVDGETLMLEYDCGDCSVDYHVEVPKGLRVKIDTGSGHITLRSLSGPLDLSAGSGDIEARGLGGRTALANTGSGDIELRYVSPPDQATLETGSGNGVLYVPKGAYNVELNTGSGDRTVQVTEDPAATRKIVIKTGSGDAKILV